MQDKLLMQDILMLEKGVCDLYMHGAIESADVNVNETFRSALNDSLSMQDEIYKQMQKKGWYQLKQADESQISSVKQKFASQSC